MTTEPGTIDAQQGKGLLSKQSILFAAVVVTCTILGLTLTASPLLAYAAFAASTVGVLALILIIKSPSGFLGAMMAFYGLLQALLLETQVIYLGSIEINASKSFVTGVTAALLLRILLELAKRRSLPRPSPAIVTSFLLVGWAVFALARTPYPGESVAVAARMGACSVAFLYAFLFIHTRRDLRYLWYGSVITTLVAGGSSVLEVLRGRGAQEALMIGAFRAEGSFGGAVATGTVCFFGMVLAVIVLAHAQKSSRRERFVAFATMAAGALGIVTTFTRTSIVGTIVFLAVYVVSRSGPRSRLSKSRRLLVAIALVAGIGVAFSLVSGETIEARFADLPGGGGSAALQSESGSGRGLIWQGLISLQSQSTASQWMIGHGLLAVQPALQRKIGIRVDGHNSVLDVLYDMGIVGLFLYVLLAWQIISVLGRAAEKDPDMAGYFTGWRAYVIAYYMSTEMFNGFVYMVGARWYTFIITGALLAFACRSRGSWRE